MVDNESVEKICSRIREDGEKEIESILEKAKQTASDILKKAEDRGREMSEKIMEEAREKGEAARRRLLSSVNLEVKRTKLKAREEVITVIRSRVEELLDKYAERDYYTETLAGLVGEAVKALEGDRFIVYLNRRDVEPFKAKALAVVLKSLGKEGRSVESIEVEPLEEHTLGGGRVSVPGGNVIFDNTFNARMYRLRDEMRNIIFEEVFPPGESEAGGGA